MKLSYLVTNLFLLSEHILCKESIAILKNSTLRFDVFIRFEISGIHLCYFRGDACMYVRMCMYVYVCE